MAAIVANIGWVLVGILIIILAEMGLFACYIKGWDEPPEER